MERMRPILIVCALAAFAAAAPIGALLELSETSFTWSKAGQMAHRELGVAEAIAREPKFSLTFLSQSPLREEFVRALRSDFAFTRANGAAGPEEVAETKAKLRRALKPHADRGDAVASELIAALDSPRPGEGESGAKPAAKGGPIRVTKGFPAVFSLMEELYAEKDGVVSEIHGRAMAELFLLDPKTALRFFGKRPDILDAMIRSFRGWTFSARGPEEKPAVVRFRNQMIEATERSTGDPEVGKTASRLLKALKASKVTVVD